MDLIDSLFSRYAVALTASLQNLRELKKLVSENMHLAQRCQLLRITRSHYGKLKKFSVFYGLRKT